jgi:hypothetical protein
MVEGLPNSMVSIWKQGRVDAFSCRYSYHTGEIQNDTEHGAIKKQPAFWMQLDIKEVNNRIPYGGKNYHCDY